MAAATRNGYADSLPSIRIRPKAISYEIDLTKPAGDRIRELQFHGKPLDPAQKLRVAVSSSRQRGEGGYGVYKGLPVVERAGDMRELLINHVTRTKTIPTEAVGNWKIVPAEAVVAMEHAADAGAGSVAVAK